MGTGLVLTFLYAKESRVQRQKPLMIPCHCIIRKLDGNAVDCSKFASVSKGNFMTTITHYSPYIGPSWKATFCFHHLCALPIRNHA